MMRRTSSPAIFPASFVACRCASLKYAGTVMTASVTRSPRNFPASSASLRSTMAEISSGAYSLPRTLNRAMPSGPGHDVVRHGVDLGLHLLEAPADEPLGGVDGALGVEDRLASSHLADEPLTLLGERHDGGGGSRSLRVGDHRGMAALHGQR